MRESRKEYLKKRKEEHEKLCPTRERSEQENKRRKARRDPKNRKIAICLGCGRVNNECICDEHKKQHFSTQITQYAPDNRPR